MLSIALGQNRRHSYSSAVDLFSRQRCLSSCTCACARCTPPSCVVQHQLTLMELNHCPNFHIARSKFPEIRGLSYCARVARAQCTITPVDMHHGIALVELYQCTRFRVASSKVPESEDAYAVHCAPCNEITCTIESRSLNSISVPNLVSIVQSFLKPEDPSQINFSGPGARSLHLTGTVTTKVYIYVYAGVAYM